VAFWMPTFLNRARGVPIDAADKQIGGILIVTGLVGTFAGGWLGDFILRRTRNAYLLLSGIATLLAAPCAAAALIVTDHTGYLAALIAAELLLFLSTGPINSAIVNYVAPTERATAMAFSILLIHAFGDVPSPYLVGAISDARRTAGATAAAGLQLAILVLPVAILISGIIWTVAALRPSAFRLGAPDPAVS
jgi:MFS transporter, Spinster family, sphingosine-1-phosphate transporter